MGPALIHDQEAAKRQAEEKQTPQSRKERRFLERKNAEVQAVYSNVVEKFLDFFTNHTDPESDEVIKRANQIDAQWRVYCTRHKLKAHAYPLVKDFCDNLFKDYFKAKAGEAIAE
jgi:hypothetical protein